MRGFTTEFRSAAIECACESRGDCAFGVDCRAGIGLSAGCIAHRPDTALREQPGAIARADRVRGRPSIRGQGIH
ncbi:hypothetical protein WJ63_27310 [Burkholderia pyrrocinia]|nr:hypothetical protein WJ63_27310 [Burkholderia pyrrocinia]